MAPILQSQPIAESPGPAASRTHDDWRPRTEQVPRYSITSLSSEMSSHGVSGRPTMPFAGAYLCSVKNWTVTAARTAHMVAEIACSRNRDRVGDGQNTTGGASDARL